MNVANSTFYNRHLKRFTIKSVRSNIVLATIFSFVFIFYGCSETHDFELVSKQSHLPINKNITVRLILQSPDQKWLATVGEDHWVRIWGRKTNSLLRSFVPGKEEIKALHFYGNDKLAIVTKKPKLLVYSILTGKQLFSQDLPLVSLNVVDKDGLFTLTTPVSGHGLLQALE